MREIGAEMREKFSIRRYAMIHRLGRLEIGETSVLIAVCSAHRAAAFDACRYGIDTLKRTVPIWKKEFFRDGAVWAEGEIPSARGEPRGEPPKQSFSRRAGILISCRDCRFPAAFHRKVSCAYGRGATVAFSSRSPRYGVCMRSTFVLDDRGLETVAARAAR